jgi:uncharacterized protein YcfJ
MITPNKIKMVVGVAVFGLVAAIGLPLAYSHHDAHASKNEESSTSPVVAPIVAPVAVVAPVAAVAAPVQQAPRIIYRDRPVRKPAVVVEQPKPEIYEMQTKHVCIPQTVQVDVADAVQPSQHNLVGAAGGAALGGLLGHQFGGGNGKTALTLLGALGGGLAGDGIGEQAKPTTHKESRQTEACHDEQIRVRVQ